MHRIDQAAQVLARKRDDGDSYRLLRAAAAELAARGGALSALATISALIRLSSRRGAEDPRTAHRAATQLLQVLPDPGDVELVRSWLRTGNGRPIGLLASRRLRRALRQRPREGAEIPAPLLYADGWHELLDILARSLAVERESELLIDVGLEYPDEASRRWRADQLRRLFEADPKGPSPPADLSTLSSSPAAVKTGPLESGSMIGRFTVLHWLGQGAVGVVYAAYDPELDRKVALKVVRTQGVVDSSRRNSQLTREAQAMAKLSHPNVVVIHEVGTHGTDVFLAMEFIRGRTLQEWVRERPRPWREIVAHYLQAGAGLAAAHAAGLVHRDFKPSNTMLGDDGRVRVLDFGLCVNNRRDPGANDDKPDAGGRAEDPHYRPLVGTPAYMPPEQFRGELAGPASDQFAFCASLYEALYGRLPFAGDTVQSLALSVGRSLIRPPPTDADVPTAVFGVLTRGLAAEAKARFPSMSELLAALDRETSQRRHRLAVLTGPLILGLVGALAVARTWPAAEDACSSSAEEIGAVWGEGPRAEIRGRFEQIGPATREELWTPAEAALNAYADAWAGAHRESCLAYRRGENSAALLDRRMVCLSQRKTALREAANVLREADREVAVRAVEIAKGLPRLEPCSDLAALARESPRGDDPEQYAEVERIRGQFERVRTLARAGRRPTASALAKATILAAEATSDRRLIAESLLLQGSLMIHDGDWEATESVLTRAFATALGAGADEVAVEALALRLYRRGRQAGQGPRALEDFALAREYVQRLPDPDQLRGLVLNNAGSVYLAMGKLREAESALREALVLRRATFGGRHIEVAYTESNLASVVQSSKEREQRMLDALEIFESELGPVHQETVTIRVTAALSLADPRQATRLLDRGCATLDRLAPGDLPQRALCRAQLADLREETDDAAGATEAWHRAAELVAHNTDADTTIPAGERTWIRCNASLHTAQRAAVVAAARAGLAALEGASEWYPREVRGKLLICLARAAAGDGRASDARADLTRAIDEFSAALSSGGARSMMLPRYLQRARLELASLPAPDPADRQRRVDVLAAAERWYLEAGAPFAWRLDQIRTLRAAKVADEKSD